MANGNDALMAASGTPWAKWGDKGDVFTGVVIDEPSLRQSRDYDSGLPAVYPSGDPKMEIVIVVQTTLRDPEVEDDDGRRQIVMKKNKNLHVAIRSAVKAAGASGVEEGGVLTITNAGEVKKKNDKGMSYTEREFTAQYAPATAAAGQSSLMGETALDADAEKAALGALAGIVKK